MLRALQYLSIPLRIKPKVPIIVYKILSGDGILFLKWPYSRYFRLCHIWSQLHLLLLLLLISSLLPPPPLHSFPLLSNKHLKNVKIILSPKIIQKHLTLML